MMVRYNLAGLIDEIERRDYVKLELGCGWSKKDKDAIGIDVDDYPDVNYLGDAVDTLRLLANDSIDRISSYHFLEHIDNLGEFFVEAKRILKPNGVIVTTVPHHSNPFFYSDPTHKQFFGLYTFSYFASYAGFSRMTPNYSQIPGLEITDIELVFKSYRPYYLRHAFKKLIGLIFNFCNYTKELYEESFSALFPCYEIRCEIVKKVQLEYGVNNKDS